jgi:acyl dehydratase
MQFHELGVGMLIEAGPRAVSEAEILEFARRYDPQWFHADPQRAAQGRWKGLIASGWHTAAIAMELMVGRILHDSTSYGSPGLENIRWLEPVRPGDELKLQCRVIKSSLSPSGSTGIVLWTWQLLNEAGRPVYECTGTSLFALGEARTPPSHA